MEKQTAKWNCSYTDTCPQTIQKTHIICNFLAELVTLSGIGVCQALREQPVQSKWDREWDYKSW